MRYDYVVAGLPYLTMDQAPPIDQDTFFTQVEGLLAPADRAELAALLWGDFGSGGSAFMRGWRAGETQLRNAVARQRLQQRGVEGGWRPEDHEGYAVWIERAVADAFGREHPLACEHGLDRCRWQLAEELEREDPFGLAGVLGFAVRLQLALRWAGFDREQGQKRRTGYEEAIFTAWQEQQGGAGRRERPQTMADGR